MNLPPYHARYVREGYYKANFHRVRECIDYVIAREQAAFRHLSKDELDGFVERLFGEPVVERRLIIRLVRGTVCETPLEPPITSAFPVFASLAYACNRLSSAEECTNVFRTLLGDNATDDLVGVVLKTWIEKGRELWLLVEAALQRTDQFIKTMKLLGYVVYGELGDKKEREKWLSRLPSCKESDMNDIQGSCLRIGTDFMANELGVSGLQAHEDWLNIDAYFHTAFEEQEEKQVVLKEMLRSDGGERPTLAPMRNEDNRKWFHCARKKISKELLDTWFSRISWEDDVPGVGMVSFFLVEDVGFQFHMANLHGSCLRLVEGESNPKVLGLITDVNKRLLVARAEDGTVIGRQIVGLSDCGLHTCPPYPQCHAWVSDVFQQGAAGLVRRLACDFARCKTALSNLCPDGITADAYPCDWLESNSPCE